MGCRASPSTCWIWLLVTAVTNLRTCVLPALVLDSRGMRQAARTHLPPSHLHTHIPHTFTHTHTLSFPPLSSPAGVPVVYQLSRRGGLDYEAFIGAFTVATSFLYHAADSLDTPVWGMAPGKWHRLDNVFSIASFGSWIIYLMDLPARRRHQLN